MKIIVIGLGSMGRRRIRLLKQLIQNQYAESMEEWRIIGVDEDQNRCGEARELLGIEVYGDLTTALQKEKADAALIAASPASHEALIKKCLENNLHVFTELNLNSNGYGANMALAREKGKVLFLSSTFLYRKEIQHIKEKVQLENFRGSYQYHVGQYLPEWHPWESYENFFIGEKKTNACREIFAIELPWLTEVFGKIKSVQSMHKRTSRLNIEYDDSFLVLIEHESGAFGSLAVDVVSPRAGRNLEIWGEGFYIEWKGTPETLQFYNRAAHCLEPAVLYDNVERADGYSEFVIENAYYEELENFVACIDFCGVPKYSFEKDQEVLEIIDRIEA